MWNQRVLSALQTWLLLASLAGVAAEPKTETLPPPKPFAAPGSPAVDPGVPATLGLDDLIQISLEQNPNLRQAAFDVDAAKGKATQAGLYPNPTVNLIGDELGDRTGPAGVNSLPLVTQEIVTGHKLQLSRSVAQKEVDQFSLGLLRQRFVLFTTVRQGYFEVLAAQRRVEILAELVSLADQSFEATNKLFKGKQVAKLDVIQFQVELNRFRASMEAAKREQVAAYRRLTASMGAPNLPIIPLRGSLEAALPDYDYEGVQAYMLQVYPDIQSARIGVDRSRLALKRAEVEPIPNVTVGAGYVRQNQNRSNDWVIQASIPIPAWNRNQGNIQAAKAEVGRAMQEVRRVENDLINRLAGTYGNYAAARERAERYRKSILPDAREAYKLALSAFQGGQFEYLRVLQAQRSVAEANLEYVGILGEQWKAASDIAGLLLEEHWPISSTLQRVDQ